MACRQQRVKGVASILKDWSASHAVGVASSPCKMLPLVNGGTLGAEQSSDPAKAELAENQLQGPAGVRTDKPFGSQLYLVPSRKGIEKPLDSFVTPEIVTKMSTLNISNLARMSRESLATLLASPAASKLAIVDVRDSGTATPRTIKVPSQSDYTRSHRRPHQILHLGPQQRT